VEVHYSNITISSHLIGLYNASNLYAAITIGKYFEVDENSIKEALRVIFQKIIGQQLLRGSNKIILDAYNANPSSMTVAIENFIQLQGLNKILILGICLN
jgi:UDP-N-acetylmuramoyl-tripeptide--D-alanyl-D-alanine ligase